jgi:hypothetical protein
MFNRRSILVTIAAIISSALPSFAANQWSQKYLAMSDSSQMAVFTLFLLKSGEKCDRVTRVMFQGGKPAAEDHWSVGCSDGNEYLIGLADTPGGETSIVSCRALRAISGRQGCWIKY